MNDTVTDTVSAWFVPAVVPGAVATSVVWGLWGPEPRLAHAVINAVLLLLPLPRFQVRLRRARVQERPGITQSGSPASQKYLSDARLLIGEDDQSA